MGVAREEWEWQGWDGIGEGGMGVVREGWEW